MPRRTEGDMYLWMIDHLRDVKDAYGEDAPRSFSDALVDYLTSKRIPVPKELLTEKDDSVKLARADIERQLHEYRMRLQQRENSSRK
jgi:hypothetical protein